MVTTRSQSNQNRQTENGTMNRSSDSESETSFPDVLSRDQIADLDSEDVLTRRQNNNNYDIDHRFNEINRQIGDLTDIVLSLTNQLASVNGEGNRLNAVTTNTNSRSDNTQKMRLQVYHAPNNRYSPFSCFRHFQSKMRTRVNRAETPRRKPFKESLKRLNKILIRCLTWR